MSNEIELHNARVFFGDVTSHAAKIYAQMDAVLLPEEVELTGTVSGPHCDDSRMLPATMLLRYQGRDPSPLAMTSVPDPTLWSPELPARYLVTLQAKRRGRVVGEESRLLGVRHFAASHRSFVNNGRRTVIRAATPQEALARQADPWRQSMLHQLVQYGPSHRDLAGTVSWLGSRLFVARDDHLEFTSAKGVPVLAVVDPADLEDLVGQLRTLERHASVRVIIVPSDVVSLLASDLHARDAIRRAKGNSVLVGCLNSDLDRTADASLTAQPNEAIAAFVIQAADISRIDSHQTAAPLIVMQSSGEGADPLPVEQLRRQCEVIQRDLTSHGDFAGYVVLQR